MRYHFFLHYGWFFHNLGKEGWRTFMHTTVQAISPETSPFLSAQMAVLSSFFQMFIVLGMYNLADQLKIPLKKNYLMWGS